MIDLFRKVAWYEGVSLLLLFCVAMPLKYMAGWPYAVKVVGMAHGVLFLVYVVLTAAAAIECKWSTKLTLFALIASVVPFGTFVFEKRFLTGAKASFEA